MNNKETPAIVGTWNLTIRKSATSPETDMAMQTFFSDGNFLETTNSVESGLTGHGIWTGSGDTF